MQRPGRKCFYGFLVVALGYIVISGIGVAATKGSNQQELAENRAWIATSKYWLDRQMCHWFGLCGTLHLNSKGWVDPQGEHGDDGEDDKPSPDIDFTDFWTSGDEDPDSWSEEEIKKRTIPQYVLDHAPYVHLFSGEQFWPCDVAEHLVHTSPYVNYDQISDLQSGRNLTNLDELNHYQGGEHGRYMYLQSNDNVEEWPEWLVGAENIPELPKKGSVDIGIPASDAEKTNEFSMHSEEWYAMLNEQMPTSNVDEYVPVKRISSPDGRCGGSSGYTCAGSQHGKCCSIYGWCGNGAEYCGEACDPLAGTCYDPRNPPRGPHPELRRRQTLPVGRQPKSESGGKSSAPAVLIVAPKEDGIVDAFWFFFYSFNLGQRVFNIRFGNHVGDWEHTMVRFQHGKPVHVFLSEHNFGHAYTWRAVEKYIPSHDGSGTMIGSWSNATASRYAKRPVVYSATGSHAMYGTPGLHPYVLPFGLLHDETDRGPLWDPVLNLQSYTYDAHNKKFRSSTHNPTSPTQWLDFAGHWGDKYYSLSDKRQYRFAGQYHYVNGPTGPKFKNLGRKGVCQSPGVCIISNWLGGDEDQAKRLPPEEDVEEGGLPGGNVTDDAW